MTASGAFVNNGYILSISFVSALGGYLFGFDFAVISGALPFLRTEFGLSAWWEGFLTGSLALGCIVGCLIAGMLSDRYGRRPGLLLAALLFASSSLGMALAGSLTNFVLMRFGAGIGVGMASMLSPMYIAEVSPAAVRGRNVAINQLTIVIGVLVTNVINYQLSDQGSEAWRWMFGLGVAPAILFFVGVLWLPESPRWLVQVGRFEKAQLVLSKIGNPLYVQQTLHAIQQSVRTISPPTARRPVFEWPAFGAVFERSVRPAVLVGIGLAIFQQLCGINVVFNYTSTIFESVGASLDRQLLETVSIGIVNVVFTLLAMRLVDRLGRRPLMLIGSLGLAILYVVLALLLQNHAAAVWISSTVLLAIAVYATSLAPVTWVLIAEVFPNSIRGTAISVATIALWGAYFILVFTFPILAQYLGTYGPFWLYAGICLLGFGFVRRNVRETKGKTLEELEGVFAGH